MNEQQILDVYNAMVAHYGDLLPDLEHQPREFQHYVKLFQYTQNANPGEDPAPQANS